MDYLNILLIGDINSGKTTFLHSFIYHCNLTDSSGCKHSELKRFFVLDFICKKRIGILNPLNNFK